MENGSTDSECSEGDRKYEENDLIRAIENSDIDEAERILENSSIDPNYNEGKFLSFAIIHCNLEMCKLLMGYGAELHQPKPCHAIEACGSKEIVDLYRKEDEMIFEKLKHFYNLFLSPSHLIKPKAIVDEGRDTLEYFIEKQNEYTYGDSTQEFRNHNRSIQYWINHGCEEGGMELVVEKMNLYGPIRHTFFQILKQIVHVDD